MNTRNENIVINVFSKVNMQSGGHNDLKLCYFSLDGNILLYKFQVLQNCKLSDINASNSFISVYIMVNLIWKSYKCMTYPLFLYMYISDMYDWQDHVTDTCKEQVISA